MTPEVETESDFEIAHVLCIDIVGYSKLLIDKQSESLRNLNEVVRTTEQFRRADAGGKLLRIPTGDGMVLVFFTHPQAPADCAAEVAKGLKAYPEIQVRMGVHSGPVNRVDDVNERTNVAGGGINIAQRVMDCGDAGHILLSKRVAEDLAQYSRWQPHLHDLGEVEVKHGVRVNLVNFFTGEIGKSHVPEKIKKFETIPRFTRLQKSLIAAALIIAIGLAATWVFLHRGAEALPVATVFPGKSIAVLPFKPLVASANDEVLEAGMADSLITKLSNTGEIIVPSLSAVRRYEDEKREPVAIGRALRTNLILEGSVQKGGDRIRVTARLIRTADGSAMWANTFDEKFTDVFAVQDAIAQKVAAALQLRLNEEEQKRLTRRYTENTEAYQLYLEGRFYWNKYTEEGWRKAIALFKRAVENDPNYALAYSGLADCYSLLAEMSYARAHDAFPQSRAYADKALALDDALASAHLSLGIVKLFYDWDLEGAGKELRRARDLDPGNAQACHFYGHYLELIGRMAEGVEETKRGVKLDPLNLILNSEVGFGYYLARQPDLALPQLRKTLEIESAFSYASYLIAQAYEEKGAYQEAIAELNRARPLSQDWSWIVGDLGYCYAKLGRQAEARKIIDLLTSRSAHEYLDPCLIAYIYIALGDTDQAFAWLDKAFQERSGMIGWLQIEPKFDPLRSDPRFIELQRRMGLPLTASPLAAN